MKKTKSDTANNKKNEDFLKKSGVADRLEIEKLKTIINNYVTEDRMLLKEAQDKSITEWKSNQLSNIIEDGLSAMGGTTKNYIDLVQFLDKSDMLLRPRKLLIGQLIFFKYMPVDERFLNKKVKKYYDIFPLLFVTETHRGGFQGINLHYLSPEMRLMLFDAIEQQIPIIPGEKTETNRKKLMYKKLKTSKTILRFFAPCYRQYRWSGIMKPPIAIPYQFWRILTEKDMGYFMKGRKNSIYLDSWSDIFKPPKPQKTKEKK